MIDRAHYGLQVAASEARNWGDDRAEQAALELLRAHQASSNPPATR